MNPRPGPKHQSHISTRKHGSAVSSKLCQGYSSAWYQMSICINLTWVSCSFITSLIWVPRLYYASQPYHLYDRSIHDCSREKHLAQQSFPTSNATELYIHFADYLRLNSNGVISSLKHSSTAYLVSDFVLGKNFGCFRFTVRSTTENDMAQTLH